MHFCHLEGSWGLRRGRSPPGKGRNLLLSRRVPKRGTGYRKDVLKYLRAIFEQCIELKWINYNPAERVTIEGQRVFTETEIVEDVGYNFDFAECERIIQGLIKDRQVLTPCSHRCGV